MTLAHCVINSITSPLTQSFLSTLSLPQNTNYLEQETIRIFRKAIKRGLSERARPREPLNILHLFLASIRARHPLDSSCGFVARDNFDYSYLGISALRCILAGLSDGARVGACTTSHLGVKRSFTKEESRKSVCFQYVSVKTAKGEKVVLHDLPDVEVFHICRKLFLAPRGSVKIKFLKTKTLPELTQVFEHFHPWGIPDLCFVCNFAKYIFLLKYVTNGEFKRSSRVFV